MLTEDTKAETLDEVWDNAELEEIEDVVTNEDEHTDIQLEEREEEEEEVKEEETEEEEEEEKPASRVDWEGLGFDKFKGKTDQEVADQIKFERQQLGHTANMLGELRREIAELKKQPAKEPVKKEEPKDVLSTIPELDDADAAKFNSLYEKNPIKAIMTYGGDPIKQMVADAVKEAMPNGSVEEVKEEIAYSTFMNTAKPNEVEVEQMRIFDKEEYLGKQGRSYSDLLGLSKMWLTSEAGSDDIYHLMKKHPTISFDEARSFVIKPEVEKIQIDKNKIKQTINKNKKVDSHPKNKAQALPSNDLSFDDAWDNA